MFRDCGLHSSLLTLCTKEEQKGYLNEVVHHHDADKGVVVDQLLGLQQPLLHRVNPAITIKFGKCVRVLVRLVACRFGVQPSCQSRNCRRGVRC